MSRRSIPYLLCLVAAASAAGPVAAAEHVWSGVERIVAVGDVHGDYEQFVAVLRSAGVLDENHDWSGGRTHLVQTGDVPDRGPETRRTLDLLRKLEEQARNAGGMVHALIGNHEAMNVYGGLQYVTPEEYAAFESPRSEARRELNYERHVNEMKERTPEERWPDFDGEYREKWMAAHPPGYFEHRSAFEPGGEYGAWIAGRAAMIQINDMLFLHGGLSPAYAETPIAEINRAVQQTLQGKARLVGSAVLDDDGPLWYRGMALNDEETEGPNVETALAAHGVKRIVIGHTPTQGAVTPRFGGKVIVIDVGLAGYYGSRQACLLIENGELFAIHRGKRLKLPTGGTEELLRYFEQAAALDPAPSPLLPRIAELEARLAALPDADQERADQQKERFLREAKLVSEREVPVGVTLSRRLTLDDGKRTHDAHFQSVDRVASIRRGADGAERHIRDSYRYNIAAYRLDRLLGLGMIPVSVQCRHQDETGACTWWVDDVLMMELERWKKKIPPPDKAAWNRQMYQARLFNELVYNSDPNLGNVLIDEDWKIWTIDFTRAFRATAALRKPEYVAGARVSRPLWENLKKLDEASLREAVGETLYEAELEGVLARRDIIVRMIQERIAQEGEAAVIYDSPAL